MHGIISFTDFRFHICMLCGGDVFLSLRKHFQSGFTGQMIPPHVRHCRARFFYSTSVLFVVKHLDGKSCCWA